MNDRFRRIAQVLNVLQPDPNARVNYELMSDALIWTDELPPVSDWETLNFEMTGLRGIFRFRTTLILGKPDERYRAGWEQANLLCPKWPGLLADRRQPDGEKIKLYEEGSVKLLRAWDELDERYERQKSKRTGESTARV